jgi:hypothetical protein
MKHYKSWLLLSILIFSLDYAAQYAYDKNSYCLNMPRADLDYARENSKMMGDLME